MRLDNALDTSNDGLADEVLSLQGRQGVTQQRLDAHGQRVRHGGRVVAPFSDEDHFAAGERLDHLNEVAERFGKHLVPPQWVVYAGIETGRHQHQFRGETVGYREYNAVEQLHIFEAVRLFLEIEKDVEQNPPIQK